MADTRLSRDHIQIHQLFPGLLIGSALPEFKKRFLHNILRKIKEGVCRLKHIPLEIDCLQFNDTVVFAVDIVSVIDKSIGNGCLIFPTKSVYIEIRILM